MKEQPIQFKQSKEPQQPAPAAAETPRTEALSAELVAELQRDGLTEENVSHVLTKFGQHVEILERETIALRTRLAEVEAERDKLNKLATDYHDTIETLWLVVVMGAVPREDDPEIAQQISTHLAAQSSQRDAAEAQVAALAPILAEVARATAKFPTWPTDPLHALAVVGEEFGELTKEVIQFTYERDKCKVGELQKEAIQTAAMAIRFYLSLNEYAYAASPQHQQAALAQPPPAPVREDDRDTALLDWMEKRMCRVEIWENEKSRILYSPIMSNVGCLRDAIRAAIGEGR